MTRIRTLVHYTNPPTLAGGCSVRNGQYSAALAEMKKALSANWQDAHLFFHAAMIHFAAGLVDESKDYLQIAAEINPHYDAFHVHR